VTITSLRHWWHSLTQTGKSASTRKGYNRRQEALEVYERLGDTVGQARCLIKLSWLLYSDKQFDAAEEAAFRAIDLLPEEGEQYRVCRSHRTLGNIYQSKGDIEKAIHHFEVALGIASSFNWHDFLFWIHYELAKLFHNEGRLDDAHAHIERAKSHTVNSTQNLGNAMELQARVWYEQHRLEEAKSEALRAAQVYERLGAAKKVERCRKLLQDIEKEPNTPVASGQSDVDCELL
jgi:tetratricopeptide (TPR) repeat protein